MDSYSQESPGGFMKSVFAAAYLLLLGSSAVSVSAQVNPYKDGTPGVTGYRSEVLAEVMIQKDKLTRLAEAIPADKFNWRPALTFGHLRKCSCTLAAPITTCTNS